VRQRQGDRLVPIERCGNRTRSSTARATLLVLAWLLTSSCLADTVMLDNGDRVTGRIQRSESGKLVIATDYAGEVKIDWTHVKTLTGDELMTVQLDDKTRLYGRLAGEDGTIRVTSPDGLLERYVEVKQVDAIFPGAMLKDPVSFSGRLNIGGSQTSGNTQTSAIHLDAELLARKGDDRYTAGGSFNRTTDRGVETASNARWYAKYDHFFAKKWYTTINATMEHDPFADIELRTTAGIGIGYQALASARTNLALESGVDYVNTNHYQLPTETYPALRLALKFDYYLIPERVQFFQGSELYLARGDDEPSFARTQTGLRMPVWKNFLATVQYNVDWNAHPPPGFVNTDRMLLLTLGYHW
jgi:putative salt-induced outer membrane protein YdiY